VYGNARRSGWLPADGVGDNNDGESPLDTIASNDSSLVSVSSISRRESALPLVDDDIEYTTASMVESI
jgi:hypothetical protein